MKHVFLVHTPITYLVSVSIIKRFELQKKDALILFQSFKDPLQNSNNPYSSINIEEINKPGNFFTTFRQFNIPIHIDNAITSATQNEKFTAYIPVVTFIQKILITHKNCIAFNFIEEGLAHYYKEETINSLNQFFSKESWRTSFIKNFKQVFREMLLTARGYNFKLQALPFSYSCYNAINNIEYFGFSEDTFPLANNSNKCVLDFKKDQFTDVGIDAPINLTDQYVWIGDPGTKHYNFNASAYLDGIKNGCIPFLKSKSVKIIFLKHHRDEPVSLRNEVEKIFAANDINTTTISDSTIMELIFLNSHNISVIGVYSSLLYYASVMGHSSYSIFNFLKKEYYRAIAGRDFSFFWNRVHLI